jgi:hypothetical protein
MNHESLFALLTAIANHLWQSTLFAGLAALVALALRKNHARVRYQLWLAASLKFLIPFALLIRLGGHLATPYRLGGNATCFLFFDPDGQPALYPNSESHRFSAAIAARNSRIAVALRFCNCDRADVAALAAGHCGDAGRTAHISGPRSRCATPPGADRRASQADRLLHITTLSGAGYLRHYPSGLALAGGDLPTPSGRAPGGYSCPRSLARAAA